MPRKKITPSRTQEKSATPRVSPERPSICKQAYNFGLQFNCQSQYLKQKGGLEEFTIQPKNDKAEKITFASGPVPVGGVSLSVTICKGGDVHTVVNITTDSDLVRAAVLVIVKAALQKNC